MSNKKPSAIVTGSSGFIGKHLQHFLSATDWNIYPWPEDIRDIGIFDRQYDVVFHTAAKVHQSHFTDNLLEGYDVNINGTIAVLNYCLKTGARCVLTSSSGVYDPTPYPQNLAESANISPKGPYNTSKWISETVARHQSRTLNIGCTVLRLFNVYGPGQSEEYLIPYVLKNLLSGDVFDIRTPNHFRDFIYVDDVVKAIYQAGQIKTDRFETINIGTGYSTKISEMITLAEHIFGLKAHLSETKHLDETASGAISDITKASADLRWLPDYNLHDGLLKLKGYMIPT